MNMTKVAIRDVFACAVLFALAVSQGSPTAAGNPNPNSETFITDDGRDLRSLVDAKTRSLLVPTYGEGTEFGIAQHKHYCSLKVGDAPVQWVVNNLETGEVIASSTNSEQLYFGASVSKLYVAAAFLDKQRGNPTRTQLQDVVRMIVVSSNPAWRSIQRQTGKVTSDYSGRVAVQSFVERMGYDKTKGFQGWMVHQDGKRVHGNELNSAELSQFLFDTYQRNYPGADVLWEIMKATRTGRGKINKYTPKSLSIAGKTGTYSGPNASPETISHPDIGARNHAAVLFTKNGTFGISVLTNTSKNEDVAVLGGGLMREYLGVEVPVTCGQK